MAMSDDLERAAFLQASGLIPSKGDQARIEAARDAMKSWQSNAWKGEDHSPAAAPRSYQEHKAALRNAWKEGK